MIFLQKDRNHALFHQILLLKIYILMRSAAKQNKCIKSRRRTLPIHIVYIHCCCHHMTQLQNRRNNNTKIPGFIHHTNTKQSTIACA